MLISNQPILRRRGAQWMHKEALLQSTPNYLKLARAAERE